MEQITFRVDGNKTFFSCGCKTEVIGKNFIMVPYSPDCEVYKYIIEETKLQEKTLSYHVSKKTLIAEYPSNTDKEDSNGY